MSILSNKRPINDELADVWATMMYEKIDTIENKKHYTDTSTDKGFAEYRRLCALQSGFLQSLSLFQCLEDGRFKRRYDEIVKAIADGRNNPDLNDGPLQIPEEQLKRFTDALISQGHETIEDFIGCDFSENHSFSEIQQMVKDVAERMPSQQFYDKYYELMPTEQEA